MRQIFALVTLLAACSPPPGPTDGTTPRAKLAELRAPLSLSSSSVIDVTQYPFSATPGQDNIDDRVVIQQAADAACALPLDGFGRRGLYFPAGDYTDGRPPAGVVDSLRITCDDLDIYGDGQGATTFASMGSGMLPASPNEPGAWKLLHITGGADRVVVSDMSLEGGAGRTVDTEEQTHLLELGQSDGTLVERVTATLRQPPMPLGAIPCLAAPNGTLCERPSHGDHTPILCHAYLDTSVTPPVQRVGLNRAVCTVDDGVWTLAGWYGGGDCFRFFSEPNVPVRNATVRYVNGPDCDRAAISGQRGVDGLEIYDSSFRTDNDTVFDFEATGGGGLKGVSVHGITLSRGESGGGGYSMTLTGNGDTGLTDASVDCAGGTIPDGGVGILDVSEIDIRNCRIDSGIVSQLATFDVRKRARRVTVRNSTIVRPAGAPALPVISVRHHTGVAPRLLTLIDTTVEQHTIAPIIDIQSLHALQLTRVKLVYAAAPWSPPSNAAETAFIIADTVPGSPQRVDSLSLNDVEFIAPPGSVAVAIRQGQAATWAQVPPPPSWLQQRSINLAKVKVTGTRSGIVLVKGTAPVRITDSGSPPLAGQSLCLGVCP